MFATTSSSQLVLPEAERNVSHNITSNMSEENLWHICQGVVSFCTIIEIYVFICLIRFHQKRRSATTKRREAKYYDHEKSTNTTPYSTPKSDFYTRRRPDCLDESLRSSSRHNRKIKVWMLRVAIMIAIFAIAKFLADQMKFFYAWNSRTDFACELANDITEVGLYGIAINCVYGFLWMRQWLFYNNPAVKGLLYRNYLIAFSKGLPVVIVSISSVLVIFHLLPQRYRVDSSIEHYDGCISVYDMTEINDAWPIVMYIVLTSTFQLSLLGLFIYPFLRRKIDMLPRHRKSLENNDQKPKKGSPLPVSRSPSLNRIMSKRNKQAVDNDSPSPIRKRDRMSIDSQSSHNFLQMPSLDSRSSGSYEEEQKSVTNQLKSNLWIFCPKSKQPDKTARGRKIKMQVTSHQQQQSSRVFRSVRRVVFWCGMCILSDVTTVTVAVLNGPGTPLILITALNNINILVNQLCIVATYSSWKQILFPLCCEVKNRLEAGFTTRVDSRSHYLDDTTVQSRRHSAHTLEAKMSNSNPTIIISSLTNENEKS